MNEGRRNISDRREAVLKIIQEEPVSTQTELMKKLSERGYAVTQATVSRDIRELKLVKTTDPDGRSVYMAPESEKTAERVNIYPMLEKSELHVNYAGNMVVLRTSAGMAQAICAAIDRQEWNGILGTIAGDDTVFAVADSEETAAAMTARLREFWN